MSFYLCMCSQAVSSSVMQCHWGTENCSPENCSPENTSPENCSPENCSPGFVPGRAIAHQWSSQGGSLSRVGDSILSITAG